jgi:Tfp pilus assembly protein PilF
MATFINPQDIEILQALGKAYLELKDGAKALYTFDTALVAIPAPRRPALVHLGRAKAFVVMGKTKDAKAAIDLAMKTEPENAEVLDLKAKLK